MKNHLTAKTAGKGAQIDHFIGSLNDFAVMLAFPNFGKIERYILSNYLNLKPGMKLPAKDMANRIRQHFKIEYPYFKIHRVRQAAYNLRRYSRSGSRKHTLIQLAMLEGNHNNFWS